MTIRTFPIASLRCAYEEKCLAPSADDQFKEIRLRRDWLGYVRRLLRFSAKVHNVGTAAYRPYLQKNAWQWHSCHRHYHSDEEFAFYDLIGMLCCKVSTEYNSLTDNSSSFILASWHIATPLEIATV